MLRVRDPSRFMVQLRLHRHESSGKMNVLQIAYKLIRTNKKPCDRCKLNYVRFGPTVVSACIVFVVGDPKISVKIQTQIFRLGCGASVWLTFVVRPPLTTPKKITKEFVCETLRIRTCRGRTLRDTMSCGSTRAR